jgi:DNA-binding NarL/FixJ family response regulator
MPEPLRVAIAEDHYLVREGLRALLEDSGEVQVIATVSTAVELLDAVATLAPDAVLTDIRMPPGHHMKASTRRIASAPNTPTSASSCSPSTPTRATRSHC